MSIIVYYIDIRTGDEDSVEFAKSPTKVMGVVARGGMKRIFGKKWEKRYRIVSVIDTERKADYLEDNENGGDELS